MKGKEVGGNSGVFYLFCWAEGKLGGEIVVAFVGKEMMKIIHKMGMKT